jgi:recombination DNA repair RAD52 pathway protein
MPLTPEQRAYLMNPLRGARVVHRSQGGKQLSYLAAWDVKAHLIRIFGFGNWDSETLESEYLFTREYESSTKTPMVEVGYKATVRLTVRDKDGQVISTQSEGAVGSASGPASMLGDHHDNALKTAASDALKRCAINWGTQFGLSLYDDGTTTDVVKGGPGIAMYDDAPVEDPGPDLTPEQEERLKAVLGATPVES